MRRPVVSGPLVAPGSDAAAVPLRPDLLFLGLRSVFALCLLGLALPAVAEFTEWRALPAELATLLEAGLLLIERPAVRLCCFWGSLVGLLLLLLELLAALFGGPLRRLALRRRQHSFLQLRSLRPQSRRGSPAMVDPAELWRALHSTLATAGARPSAALLLQAHCDEPATFGIAPAGGSDHRALCHALANLFRAHDAEVQVETAVDPISRVAPADQLYCVELVLLRPPWVPLADPAQTDLLAGLVAALRLPAGVDYAEIQWLVQPRQEPLNADWRVFARRRATALRQRPGAAAELQALEAKLADVHFDLSLRLLVAAAPGQSVAARAWLDELVAVLARSERRAAYGRQLLRPVWRGKVPAAQARLRMPRLAPPPPRLWPRPLWAPPALLSATELSGCWHLPGVELRTLVQWLPNRQLPAPARAFVPVGDSDRIVLGQARRGDGSLAPVGPGLRELRQVLHLTAGMGAGKSRVLANIAQQLLPGGFFLLDGKGDDVAGNLVATVRSLIPVADEQRLLIIDPLDAAWPVAINPLHGIDLRRAGGMSQALGMVLAIFERLDPETWARSMGMQQFAQMGAMLVLEGEPCPSLAALKRVLEDEHYRGQLLEQVQNPEVRTFWLETYPQSGEQQRGSRDALLRRLDNLLVDETLRYMLVQTEAPLDLLEAMEQGLIVLIPLPHVTLGGLAGFVAMLLFQAIVRAAFRRPGSDQSRRTVPLIIDEFQVFIGSGDTADVRAAITQLRSLGIGGIYAHQSLGQLGALKDEMLQNSAVRLILRTGEPDASAYATLFPTTDLTAADISGQPPDEHQYLILAGSEPCSIQPLPWPVPVDAAGELPPYSGPAWQSLSPADTPALMAYDRTLLQIMYSEDLVQRMARDLARLSAADWQFLLERWALLRRHQREHVLANPACIPDRLERQRWLSRLAWATPRVLAMAAYERAKPG